MPIHKDADFSIKGRINPNIPLGRLADVLLGKLVREVNRRLVVGENMDVIFKFIDGSLTLIIPYDHLAIGIIDNDRISYWWSSFKFAPAHLQSENQYELDASIRRVVETGKPRIISDLALFSSQNPGLRGTRFAVRQGLRSSMVCPLKSKGKNFGVVSFLSHLPHTYEDEHLETFLEISEQLSAVIVAGWPTVANRSVDNSQALRMVLHDLRNPLGVIQGLLDIYTRSGALDKNVSDVLLRNTNFMLGILDNLTAIDQISNSTDAIKKCEVDLKEFFDDIIGNARVMAEQKEINFIAEVERSLPVTGTFDPVKLRRAIDNLISNALKFSPRNTRIEFSVRPDKGGIAISVKDHGQGIPHKEFSKLFKEFGKTSTVPTEGEHSTGLGLVIVKRIIEQHGGRLDFKSAVGQGSTFSVWLPIEA